MWGLLDFTACTAIVWRTTSIFWKCYSLCYKKGLTFFLCCRVSCALVNNIFYFADTFSHLRLHLSYIDNLITISYDKMHLFRNGLKLPSSAILFLATSLKKHLEVSHNSPPISKQGRQFLASVSKNQWRNLNSYNQACLNLQARHVAAGGQGAMPTKWKKPHEFPPTGLLTT